MEVLRKPRILMAGNEIYSVEPNSYFAQFADEDSKITTQWFWSRGTPNELIWREIRNSNLRQIFPEIIIAPAIEDVATEFEASLSKCQDEEIEDSPPDEGEDDDKVVEEPPVNE